MHAEFNKRVQSMNRGACGTNKLSLHPITARWKMGQVVLCMTVFLIVQIMQISVSSYDYDHEFKQLAS